MNEIRALQGYQNINTTTYIKDHMLNISNSIQKKLSNKS